ncbi:hypothetical protein RUM43_009126 [Polyplax serrata]|uniref:Mannose-P-dolichol utilization defect 1 protein homolog n=1 Tax=Polyplax serrata TaxID=468196 RepID=A0AAN8P7F6_POLSC
MVRHAMGVQALSNYKRQSTGQLSAVTLWMQFAGCLARVFTSIQETGDATMILTYVTATILNGLILFQLYYYASGTGKKGKGKGKRKDKKSD